MLTDVRPHIRWMIRRDMPEVLRIEAESFEFPWTYQDFGCTWKQRNCIGRVAEHDDRVVGFVVYQFSKAGLRILNLAVADDMRRCGVGSALVKNLQAKVTATRRTLSMVVRETNLAAQLFFRAMGFRATKIVRDYYVETDEDAYRFVWRMAKRELVTECRGK